MAHSQKRKRYEVISQEKTFEPHWLSSYHQEQGDKFSASSCGIEAYETDIILKQESTAKTLEVPVDPFCETLGKGETGSALIRWEAGTLETSGEPIWVDRYDARLLLSEYPECCRSLSNASSITPSSPSGWSDLPSDTEDAFFLSASEIAELRHTKQQKALEDARSLRLSALRAAGDEEDENNNDDDGDPWGDSDEEPDEAQCMLMGRTATHLRGAENRTLLTARILANHGADKRFAFLRGRWKRAWLRAQAQAIAKVKADAERDKYKVGLMGLNNYADSDEEDPPSSGGEKPPPVLVTNEADSEVSELKKQEMRRARAREWAAKRRLQTQN